MDAFYMIKGWINSFLCIWFSYYVSTLKLLVDNGEIKLDIISILLFILNCLAFHAKYISSKDLIYQQSIGLSNKGQKGWIKSICYFSGHRWLRVREENIGESAVQSLNQWQMFHIFCSPTQRTLTSPSNYPSCCSALKQLGKVPSVTKKYCSESRPNFIPNLVGFTSDLKETYPVAIGKSCPNLLPYCLIAWLCFLYFLLLWLQFTCLSQIILKITQPELIKKFNFTSNHQFLLL